MHGKQKGDDARMTTKYNRYGKSENLEKWN